MHTAEDHEPRLPREYFEQDQQLATVGHGERLGTALAALERRECGRFHLRKDGIELQLGLARLIGFRSHRRHDGLAAVVIAEDIGGADDPGRLDHGGDHHAALPACRFDHGGAHRGLDEHRDGAAT